MGQKIENRLKEYLLYINLLEVIYEKTHNTGIGRFHCSRQLRILQGSGYLQVGTPYVIVALYEEKEKLTVESFAMAPNRLFLPSFRYGEMPSLTVVAFDGACQHLLNIYSEMAPEDRDLFPTPLTLVDADRTEMFHTVDYHSPLGKIRELTQSDALRKYIDAIIGT